MNLKASWLYIVSSRPAKATQSEPVSKNKTQDIIIKKEKEKRGRAFSVTEAIKQNKQQQNPTKLPDRKMF